MTSTESTLSNSTMSRLLDGAERSLLCHGYQGASIRRITREAGANVAAVNYHFGSKQALFAALFQRRMSAVAQRREEALQAIEARAGISVGDVVQAYFGALCHFRESSGKGAAVLIWILLAGDREASRLAGTPIGDSHVGLRRRYAQVLASAIQDVPATELEWRLDILERFALCAMAGPDACRATGPACESLSEGLVSIIEACLRAPHTV